MKKVSEVSALVGVSRRTLQYYDDEGLITVQRSKDNYRLYDEAAMERVWQILVYRAMDIELKDISLLLDLNEDERNTFLGRRIEEIQEEIDELKEKERFILHIKEHGMPVVPPEDKKNGRTYVEHISTLKQKLAGGECYEKV